MNTKPLYIGRIEVVSTTNNKASIKKRKREWTEQSVYNWALLRLTAFINEYTIEAQRITKMYKDRSLDIGLNNKALSR